MRFVLSAVVVLVLAVGAHADLINGGFEVGDLAGWSSTGDVSVADTSLGVSPTEGAHQAILTTIGGGDIDGYLEAINPYSGSMSVSTATVESFLEMDSGKLTGLGHGSLANTEGSALFQTFSVTAGQRLAFDWNFLTNEFTPEPTYNDFAFLVLDGTLIQLADLDSTFQVSGSDFFQETGWSSISYLFTASGSFTLGFGISDAGDDLVTSALLVDNIHITDSLIPEPATVSLMGIGLATLALRSYRRRQTS